MKLNSGVTGHQRNPSLPRGSIDPTSPGGTIGSSDHIDRGAIKVIEVIGVSDQSFEDAVELAVAKAAESIKGITGVEVEAFSAKVSDGKVTQYRATVKLAFVVK